MKITRQGLTKPHPPAEQLAGLSGVRELAGEDLEGDSRKQYQRDQQRRWLDQQVHEKQMQQDQNNMEENYYATQTNECTRMRGVLEDHFSLKKRHMEECTKQYNKILAQAKRDREAQERQNQVQFEKTQLSEVKLRGKKISFPNKDAEYCERGAQYRDYLAGMNERKSNEMRTAKLHFDTVVILFNKIETKKIKKV